MELRSLNRCALVLCFGLALMGCGKKKPPASLSTAPPPATTAPDAGEDGSFAEYGSESSGINSSDINRGFGTDNAAVPEGLQRIHFEYDQSEITGEGRQILDQNAAYMRGNAGVQVEVGGHCDERGSTDYNIALGERRAQTAYRYLTDLGIAPGRMRVVSFGEDRPLSFGHTEYDYALNRRVEFRPVQ
jgi:peptidoglycan-associated lipoprotein